MVKTKSYGRSGNQPFHFCKTICLLLATTPEISKPTTSEKQPNFAFATNSSECCDYGATYYISDGVVRKRRPPKMDEIWKVRPKHKTKNVCFQLATGRTSKHKSKSWTTDSGATVSVTNDIGLFETIDDIAPNKRVRVANNQSVSVQCIGTVKLHLLDSTGRPYTLLLSNVHYSPFFSSNLLSVNEMYRQHKISTTFRGNKAQFTTPDGVDIPIAFSKDRQYLLEAMSIFDVNAKGSVNAYLWHKRFMHAGNAALKRMACRISQLGCEFDFSKCDACLQGGGRRKPVSTSSRVASRSKPDDAFRKIKKQRFTYFGERISSDLVGPMPIGLHGEKYAICFHDSKTSYTAVYFLKSKDKEDVLQSFQTFLREHQDVLPYGVGKFHTDNGGEYLNSDMEAFCDEICIKRSFTIPYEAWQNPYAERIWGQLLRPVRTALADSKSDERFWPDLFQHATLIHNILLDENCTCPFEQVYGESFDYETLHTPLCLCYYFLPEKDRASKLSPRALPATYLGPDSQRQGHKVYVHGLQRYTSSYHVVFNEHRYYDVSLDKSRVTFGPNVNFDPSNFSRHYDEDRDDSTPDSAGDSNPSSNIPFDQDVSPRFDPLHTNDGIWNPNHCSNSKCLFPNGHTGPCSDQIRTSRLRSLPRQIYSACSESDCIFHSDHSGTCVDEFGQSIGELCQSCADDDFASDSDYDFHTLSVVFDDVSNEILNVDNSDLHDVPTPKQYEDTQSSPLKDKWNESMQTEWEALVKNGTFEFVSHNDPRLKNRKLTKSRWVYTIKYNRDGTIERFKSRFVACGYSQRAGIDYDRVFSATLRGSSFRTLLAIASGKKMRLMQFDVSNAFVQADMDDVDVFLEPAKGFGEYETINGKKVPKPLRLVKALYGTKQASRLWQEALRTFLT